MKSSNFDHPAAKLLVKIAESQDEDYHDGTTSVVLLTCELLKQLKPIVKDADKANEIKDTIRAAMKHCSKKIDDLAVRYKDTDDNEKKQLEFLKKCATTALYSNCNDQQKEFLSKTVADVVFVYNDQLSDKSFVNIRQHIGVVSIEGDTQNSDDIKLVSGVAFKRNTSFCEFELEECENCKIAFLKNHDINYNICKIIAESGTKIVLSEFSISDNLKGYFTNEHIFCADRVSKEDFKRTIYDCSGSVTNGIQDIVTFGNCALFKSQQFGEKRIIIFQGQA